MADTKKRYNHTVAPVAVAHADGNTVLKANLSGTFPGSPVALEFDFAVVDRKIASLEIHS